MSVDFNRKIYGYDDLFNFIKLDKKEIPNKLILSGNKESVNLLLHII